MRAGRAARRVGDAVAVGIARRARRPGRRCRVQAEERSPSASGSPSASASVSADWATVAVAEAIESVPERCAWPPNAGRTERRTVPLPAPAVPSVGTMHGTFDVTVHAQLTREGVTAMSASPPDRPDGGRLRRQGVGAGLRPRRVDELEAGAIVGANRRRHRHAGRAAGRIHDVFVAEIGVAEADAVANLVLEDARDVRRRRET